MISEPPLSIGNRLGTAEENVAEVLRPSRRVIAVNPFTKTKEKRRGDDPAAVCEKRRTEEEGRGMGGEERRRYGILAADENR